MNDTKDTIFTPLLITKLSCALIKGPLGNMKKRKTQVLQVLLLYVFTVPFHFNEIFANSKKRFYSFSMF